MWQAAVVGLQIKLDDWRVRQHFKRVEVILRDRDVSHLAPTLQLAREHYLGRLHDYAARGIFPRNHERPGYAPCFIDRDGRECAVAHLVMSSGQAELAYKIAAVSNYAYVPEIEFPELDDWAAQAGLSRDELTLVQPGYYVSLTGSFLSIAIAIWVTGLLAVVINTVSIARQRRSIVIPILSLVVAVILLLVADICLNGAMDAYALGTHPDGFPYDLPLRDVGPLIVGVLISVGLALLIGVLCLNRICHFFNAWRENREPIVGDRDTLT